MTVDEVISQLSQLKREHGVMEVFLDVWTHGLMRIDEIAVDADDTGIILYGEPVDACENHE